jgi:hypothetical protein
MAKDMKELIMQAIDKYFVLELHAKQTGYLNVTLFQMIFHHCNQWATLDFVVINALMAECDSAWSLHKIPTKYVNSIDKARRQ